MPTYEYACSSCGHRFDVRQSFNDDPITDCPKCGASVRRVLYPAGVIFKGSGWYATDSRKAQASHSEASTESTASEKTDSSASSKQSETTTASTTSKEKAKAAADD